MMSSTYPSPRFASIIALGYGHLAGKRFASEDHPPSKTVAGRFRSTTPPFIDYLG
ncbi:hypothetical protein [Haladaptatus sp. NG-SE-30]